MNELIKWGGCDNHASQGWMHRLSTSTWEMHWSEFWGTLERDGPVEFRDKAWRSENDRYLSYPKAIMDDFGFLVPV